MAESQSLVPVAAIVDLILGFVTIALVRRSSQKEWVETVSYTHLTLPTKRIV